MTWIVGILYLHYQPQVQYCLMLQSGLEFVVLLFLYLFLCIPYGWFVLHLAKRMESATLTISDGALHSLVAGTLSILFFTSSKKAFWVELFSTCIPTGHTNEALVLCIWVAMGFFFSSPSRSGFRPLLRYRTSPGYMRLGTGLDAVLLAFAFALRLRFALDTMGCDMTGSKGGLYERVVALYLHLSIGLGYPVCPKERARENDTLF
jgi:hypothetical protein